MRVLLIGYDRPDSNSGIHIFNLANRLAEMGVDAMVAAPAEPQAVESLGPRHFKMLDFGDLRTLGPADMPDLIHAWTPRERVRQMVDVLRERSSTPYVVHMEDNEDVITSVRTGLPLVLLQKLPARLTDVLLGRKMAHPRRYPGFLRKAAGLTLVTEALGALCPRGVSRHLLWAGYEEGLPWEMEPDMGLRRRLGLDERERVISYTGNAHAGNWREVSDLYRAVDLLRQRGLPVRLVRTGRNYLRRRPWRSGALSSPHSIELGFIPRAGIPAVLSIASVLVQPGKPGPLSDFRFPSKLPEFLASGRPVVLPATNIGLHLDDGRECLLLQSGTPSDIADKVQELLQDPTRGRAMGRAGQEFARRHLRWGNLAVGVKSFYERVLGRVQGD